MNKNKNLKKYKGKRRYRLSDIYEILERIYLELSGGKYSTKRLGKLMRGFPGYRVIKRARANIKPYPKTMRPYSELPKQKYNPKPKPALNLSRGKPWNEPPTYKPRERLVYDPEVKNLLQKIEKHLKDGFESKNLEQMDIDELLTSLEKKYDRRVYEKLLEKQLEEINKAEPEPKLYELNEEATKDTEPSKVNIIDKHGDEKEEKIESLEEANLSEILEKAGQEEGMSIVGPLEIDDDEFERLKAELKAKGETTEQGVESAKVEDVEHKIEIDEETAENPELDEIEEMMTRANEAYLEEHKDELIERLIGDIDNPEIGTDERLKTQSVKFVEESSEALGKIQPEEQNEINVRIESELGAEVLNEPFVAENDSTRNMEIASLEPSLEVGSLYEEVLADPYLWPELEPERVEHKPLDAEPEVEQTGV